ncbi:threonine/serine ThrE exporter family protein [Microbacterium schleiferi]|uniref:threonine/serine ThrE exporter family protein n=1 Tax=Microbacterium schleiferi TaxID=69362 RepID=UPI001E4F65E0|nr:threonine/serine exporter family protein [Microbacterium schleiferi]
MTIWEPLAMPRRRRLPNPFGRLLRAPSDPHPGTEALPIVDDATAVRILDLAVRLGETMLVTGAPASEVTFAIVRAAEAFGLHPVHIDVTYNSITAAYHRSGEDRPITLLRVVRAAAPDYEKLLRLQALLSEITAGLPLTDARARLTEIRRTPFSHRPIVVIAAQGLLAVGVAVMFGGNPVVTVLAFFAAALAALTQLGLSRARVPFFFSQITAAAVLTLFASLAPALAATGLPGAAEARPSVVVASAIVLMLAGLTVVGAAQDAIDGFALTASGRILELMTQTLGVVIGILVGLQVASLVGLAVDPPARPSPWAPSRCSSWERH